MEENPDLLNAIAQITTGLGLTLACDEAPQGEVCFANSPVLRPEFKQTYTATDLANYIYAVRHIPACYQKHQDLLNTNDPVIFWNLVETGAQARQLKLQENTRARP